MSLTAMTFAAQQSGTVQGGVPASGAVPNLIKYSGVLKDASGGVLTTLSYAMKAGGRSDLGGLPASAFVLAAPVRRQWRRVQCAQGFEHLNDSSASLVIRRNHHRRHD